ncbi:hypothetical protein PoB_006613000 [Plakobranchus ocellatus]|uniref:Uncharacterized protein n=1 Tax=Plakobranchus ocellatus TaxID=259542 RepID=A0AAV4D666_9GAST|nr:hypothetical protein PoB_006613000 [Plakobranchus ocellatus]
MILNKGLIGLTSDSQPSSKFQQDLARLRDMADQKHQGLSKSMTSVQVYDQLTNSYCPASEHDGKKIGWLTAAQLEIRREGN